jgi:hypothetical protein
MPTAITTRRFGCILCGLGALLLLAQPARAYVDLAPTLGRIINSAPTIVLVEVGNFSAERQMVFLKPVRALKGPLPPANIRHIVAPANSTVIPRPILRWATAGAGAILFSAGDATLVCFGPGWYQVSGGGEGGVGRLGADRPDLPLAYYGSVPRLEEAIQTMLAGRDAVITAVAFGADNEGASFDLALNRQNLPGLIRLQRLRANLRMPPTVAATSTNPAYVLGFGPVDEDDLPALREKLTAPQAAVRTEAAADIRSLATRARVAAADLAARLADDDATVRVTAASSLLRVAPHATARPRAIEILAAALDGPAGPLRLAAIEAAGLAGPAGAELTAPLARLVAEDDAATRSAAVLALTVLGPAAAEAAPAILPLLDDPAYALDAAEALGRFGSAARAALPRLSKMLAADDAATRWTAVRAMAQIGGPEAYPAVQFMIRALPQATEVEAYNMFIYLALLGPVAADALPAIRNSRVRLNPNLPRAAEWAIAPERTFPWLDGSGMADGPGALIYRSLVRELGARLRPIAGVLARRIMNGTAGNVPLWGYEILACGPEDALAVLVPHLQSNDLIARERAAVALGYMGPAAAPAATQVQAAVAKAANERERRLLQWCLREIEEE